MSLKLHNIHKACLTANLHWVQVFHVQVLWYLTVQTNQRAHHEEEELGNLIWNKNTPFAARVVSHRLKVAQRGWGASLQLWRSSKPHWAFWRTPAWGGPANPGAWTEWFQGAPSSPSVPLRFQQGFSATFPSSPTPTPTQTHGGQQWCRLLTLPHAFGALWTHT